VYYSNLAQEIDMVPKKHHKQIRAEICAAVKTRTKELAEVTILAARPETVHGITLAKLLG
jgi:hypothetical protein